MYDFLLTFLLKLLFSFKYFAAMCGIYIAMVYATVFDCLIFMELRFDMA